MYIFLLDKWGHNGIIDDYVCKKGNHGVTVRVNVGAKVSVGVLMCAVLCCDIL